MTEDNSADEPGRDPPSTWLIWTVLILVFVLTIAMLVGLIELLERL
ncbi:hypothetical protein [Nocardioides halotolerans]|jgi:hypothetical protein|nr:hypothetical protein [Nocardioides halotolerans]